MSEYSEFPPKRYAEPMNRQNQTPDNANKTLPVIEAAVAREWQ
jgi:hypothetical protein